MGKRSKEEQRILSKKHYLANKDKYLANQRKRRERNRKFVRRCRRLFKCIVCGEARAACLDFHHIDAKQKVNSISNMIREMASINALKIEMKKCVILCANCHRFLHHGQ